jgi:hypothetical protein
MLRQRRKSSEVTVARGAARSVLFGAAIVLCVNLFEILTRSRSYTKSGLTHGVLSAILIGAGIGWIDWYLSVRFIRTGKGLDSEVNYRSAI